MGLFFGLILAFLALLWAALAGRRERRARGRRAHKATTTQGLSLQIPGAANPSGEEADSTTERLGGAFAALPEGTLLGDRYVVREVRAIGPHHTLYLAEEVVASRRCTVCSAVVSDPEERFCSTCGADLANSLPTVARYLVSETDDDRAVRCERQLLAMQLDHPGLLLPVAVFEEVHHGEMRTYRVMPEFSLPLLQSQPRPDDVAMVVRWGEGLAASMAFLHKHQVALGVVDAAHIAVDGPHAFWAGLNDATIIPPEQRASAQDILAQDILGLGHVLAGLLAVGDAQEPNSAVPAALSQLLVRVLDSPARISAAALASDLQSILAEMEGSQSAPVWVGHRTDVGLTRQLNEDSFLVLDLDPVSLLDGSAPVPSGLYVVADGMGGYDAGEVASGLVVQVIASLARGDAGQPSRPSSAPVKPAALLKHWVEEANRAVHEARRAADSEMGTTLVAALLVGREATIANVGDSRCYHMGAGGIRRVTTDHSLVERLVATGQISRAEVGSHPQRNVIYRAIGDKPEVEIDLFEQSLLNGEALLLCSDGLNGMVSDERLLQLWRTSVSPQEACDRMVAAANEAGGEDNITVIIVQDRRNGDRRNGDRQDSGRLNN